MGCGSLGRSNTPDMPPMCTKMIRLGTTLVCVSKCSMQIHIHTIFGASVKRPLAPSIRHLWFKGRKGLKTREITSTPVLRGSQNSFAQDTQIPTQQFTYSFIHSFYLASLWLTAFSNNGAVVTDAYSLYLSQTFPRFHTFSDRKLTLKCVWGGRKCFQTLQKADGECRDFFKLITP